MSQPVLMGRNEFCPSPPERREKSQNFLFCPLVENRHPLINLAQGKRKGLLQAYVVWEGEGRIFICVSGEGTVQFRISPHKKKEASPESDRKEGKKEEKAFLTRHPRRKKGGKVIDGVPVHPRCLSGKGPPRRVPGKGGEGKKGKNFFFSSPGK